MTNSSFADPVNGLLGHFIQRPRATAVSPEFNEGGILQALPRIQARYALAIFVLASATLSYQILITRFFSVMLYYHFAFAAFCNAVALRGKHFGWVALSAVVAMAVAGY